MLALMDIGSVEWVKAATTFSNTQGRVAVDSLQSRLWYLNTFGCPLSDVAAVSTYLTEYDKPDRTYWISIRRGTKDPYMAGSLFWDQKEKQWKTTT